MTSLSDAAAESLSKHWGKIYLSSGCLLSEKSIDLLSDESRDEILSTIRFGNDPSQLDTGEWVSISQTQAEILANYGWFLNLNGLNKIDDDVASALSRHLGTLSLMGLSQLSEDAARHLASHAGPLLINIQRFETNNAVLDTLRQHPTVFSSIWNSNENGENED